MSNFHLHDITLDMSSGQIRTLIDHDIPFKKGPVRVSGNGEIYATTINVPEALEQRDRLYRILTSICGIKQEKLWKD